MADDGAPLGPAFWPRVIAAVAVSALFAWSFWQRWRWLASSPYPLGVDGYFYPIQLRELWERGELYYPSAPVAVWLMATWAALTRTFDAIVAVKLATAFLGALAVVPTYLLGRRIGGSRVAGFLSAVVLATSAEAIYLASEFVKNAAGITVALFYLWALARACDSVHGRRPVYLRAGLAGLLLVMVFATHKLAFVLAVVASVPPIVAIVAIGRDRMHDRPGWPGGVALRRVALVIAALLAVVIVPGLLAPGRFFSVLDVALLGDLFTATPDVSLPVLSAPARPALFLDHEVAVAGIVALLAVVFWLLEPRLSLLRLEPLPLQDRALILGPAAIAVFAALPWIDVSQPDGPGFRLRLIGFVGLALAAAALCRVFFARLAPLWRTAIVVPFAIAFLLARPEQPREGVVEVSPALQAAVRALRGVVPDSDTIIVPERHILFMAVYYARAHVVLRPETVPRDRRWRLVPMAHMSPHLRDAIDHVRQQAPPGVPLPRSLHPRHRNGLVVMPEATWEWLLGQLPPDERDHYERWVTI